MTRVRGYRRRDGTRVRGHYRRSSQRSTGGGLEWLVGIILLIVIIGAVIAALN